MFLQKRGKEIYFGLKVFFFGENVKNIMKPKAISILAPTRATFKINLVTFSFTPVDVVRVWLIMDKTQCPFQLLRRYDVNISPRIVALLKEVDVDSLRSLSQLDSPDKLVGLQEAIRESVSEPARLKNEEEKFVLLVDKFASAPSTFKFSFGEKLMLKDAINMAKNILFEYSKQ